MLPLKYARKFVIKSYITPASPAHSNKMFSRLPHLTWCSPVSFETPWRQHVTASKLGIFMHLDDLSAQEQARRSFGKKPVPKPTDYARQAMDHGTFYEGIARNTIVHKLEFFKPYYLNLPIGDGKWSFTGTWKKNQTKESFLVSATPDMVIWSNADGTYLPVEIKCPFKAWQRNQPLDEVPIKMTWVVQALLQALIIDSPFVFIVMYYPQKGGENKPESRPEQWVVYQLERSVATDNVIVESIYHTYDRLKRSKTGDDFILFRSPAGESKNKTQYFSCHLRDHCKVVNKQVI